MWEFWPHWHQLDFQSGTHTLNQCNKKNTLPQHIKLNLHRKGLTNNFSLAGACLG